jgi:DNA uptake protein ComE-like DNA-binding protein
MKDRIKDYFAFNRKEQRGLIILLGLILLCLLVRIYLPRIIPEKKFDIAPFQQQVEAFEASIGKIDSAEAAQPKNSWDKSATFKGSDMGPFLASPFYFDPNNISEQQWLDMGIGSKIAGNISRYKAKGGSFRDKEGLHRIYGMEDSVFAILEPYLKFKEKEKDTSSKYHEYKEKEHPAYAEKTYKKYEADTIVIEINSADSSALLGLKGIGPSFAGRIIKYRERLGGFTSPGQLLEIWGMDSLRYDQFKSHVNVDTSLVRKIDLNAVTFKELLRHPYFEYYLVKAIFNYKDDVKAFDSVGQLRKIPVMYEELYRKIEPYLEVK